MEKNQSSWNLAGVVDHYNEDHTLQAPEKTILESLKPRMHEWDVLDIGVGTGRTTAFLAPLVKKYTGTDYAENMILSCRKRFGDSFSNMSLQVGDARLMPEFETGAFDFVLFSFNGLDYIGHEDRLKALKEIKRVCKPGGYFAFSTHNLRAIGGIYSIEWTPHPKYMLYQFYKITRLLFKTGLPGKYRDKEYAVIHDGLHHFKIVTYYIQPEVQVRQLQEAGFEQIRLFSVTDGKETHTQDPLLKKSPWVYFLCQC